jgi:hypothetical protein
MVFNLLKGLCCLVLALVLVACSVMQQQPTKLAELSRTDFMNAMRWKQYDVASNLMVPEHRKEFMKTFVPLKNLHIVDVQIIYLQPSEENRRFETTIELEYYLPPSVTVKTFTFDQTWVYFEGEDPTHQGFLITTPFPDFPGEDSVSK